MAEVYTWVISQANVTATTAPSTGRPTRTARVSRRTGSRTTRKNFGRSRLTTTAVSATSSSSFTGHRSPARRTPGSRRRGSLSVSHPSRGGFGLVAILRAPPLTRCKRHPLTGCRGYLMPRGRLPTAPAIREKTRSLRRSPPFNQLRRRPRVRPMSKRPSRLDPFDGGS